MQNTIDPINETLTSSAAWFDSLVASIRADELKIETGTADPKTVRLYENMIQGNREELMATINKEFNQFYISEMLVAYVNELLSRKRKPDNLFVYHHKNNLNIWAIIHDDDEETEAALYLSEAALNAKYSDLGFYIDTMVLEVSDKSSIPAHYQKLM